MAIKEILKYPDPFLKTKAKPVIEVTGEVRALIDDMIETMYDGRGVGLAATQVGSDKRVIVLDVPPEDPGEGEGEGGEENHLKPETAETRLIAIVNPEIVSSEGATVFEEGCLSIPGINADVKRAEFVKVTGLSYEGKPITIETGGLFAIALQHEIDHLDGVLFIDRISRLKRDLLKRKYRKLREAEAEDEAV